MNDGEMDVRGVGVVEGKEPQCGFVQSVGGSERG